MLVISSDIDGVLANLLTGIYNKAKQDFGVDIGPLDIDKFDLAVVLKKFDIPSTWLYKVFKDEWFWAGAKPFQENIDVLNQWKEQGHFIHLITSRKNDVAVPTVAWLKKAGVKYDRIDFAQTMKKHEVMSEVNSSVIFEDRFYEANKCASFGFDAFVIRRPYNQEFEPRCVNPRVRFIDNFEEANEYISNTIL